MFVLIGGFEAVARAGAVLGITGGAIGLMQAIFVLVILHLGTGVVAFRAPNAFIASLYLIIPAVLSLLAILAAVYSRKNYRLSGLLLIIAGIGLGLSGAIGFWAAALLLIAGGILFLLHDYRRAKQPQ